MNPGSVHVGMYGAVMGIAGLGLTARAAATALPGFVRAPAYVTEPWVLLGLIALAAVLFLYGRKLVRDPAAVRADFVDPVTLGFCGALPVGMSLVAGGVAPYWPLLGDVLWWLSAALLLGLQIWAFYRLLCGGMTLEDLNAGWLLIIAGGVVLPGPGMALGHGEASHFFFGVSAAAAPVVTAVLLYRAAIGAPLPEALRPTWFILLVPPSLIYANGIALFPGSEWLELLFAFGLVLAVALLVYARSFWRWRFGAPWWAFTFPLDALAYAAVRYAQDHPEALWKWVAGASLALATIFVALVLVRQLVHLASPPSRSA